MRNRTTGDIEKRARVWERVLESLRRRGGVEAETVAAEIGLAAEEIRAVCWEMAELGWLELRAESQRWVAGESADELLRRYPALRSDVAGPSVGPDGRERAAN